MITKEEALKIAAPQREGKTNHCEETEKYWIFSDTDAEMAFGGYTMPLAIAKKDGKAEPNYTLSLIFHDIEDSDVLRTYSIDEEGKFTLI